MDALFPFGFPGATAFYLAFFVLTLVVHWVFMNYVLAGTAYTLIARAAWAKRGCSDPADQVLRDWLPLMLSGAITAGIAPLLFLQILYQHQFYTANLLLFHRWMIMLPTLIAGFYLLYLLRLKRFDNWPPVLRGLIALATFGCFGFVAWSWTENHLLSLHQNVWPQQYGSGRMFYWTPEVLPRWMMWIALALPTMTTIVAWQLRGARNKDATGIARVGRRLSWIALAGIVFFVAAASAYVWVLPNAVRSVMLDRLTLPYILVAGLGLAVQAAAWLVLLRQGRLSLRWLVAASIGILLTQVGVAVAREGRRLASIDITSLYARHAAAAKVGGFAVFVAFLLINAALVATSILIVRRGTKALPNVDRQ